MTPNDFFTLGKKHDAQMVDLKFTDLLGTWQHCSFPCCLAWTWNPLYESDAGD
jgi:glutamine synthetase